MAYSMALMIWLYILQAERRYLIYILHCVCVRRPQKLA